MSRSTARLIVVFVCIVALSVVAQAQTLGRAFVSTSGSDTNSCNATAPCRTFTKALSVIVDKGEVVALASGGYGSATITKSASIFVPMGLHAGVTATSGDGITVNAGATDVVVLRGVHLNGTGGVNAITANSVGTLYVENCQITGFTGDGVRFLAGDGKLVMRNTDVRSCGQAGLYLASLDPLKAYIAGCSFSGCDVGVELDGQVAVTVADCSANGNTTGFLLDNSTATTASVTLAHARAIDNATGVRAGVTGGGSASISFVYSVISQNTVGISTSGGTGVIKGSDPGTSVVSGNGTDVSGTLSTAMTLY